MPNILKWSCLLFALTFLHSTLLAYNEYPLPERLSSETQMSILVASPSDKEVYTMYGHAGYRVLDYSQNLDLTFNYGIFSFSDDFLFRFVKGQTDYMVMPQYTADYMSEYLGRGSKVTELVLNLSNQEMERVWSYLRNNIKPEHRKYRYHFFKDNCSTRPLWLVDMAVGGLQYSNKGYNLENRTWRDEINMLEASNPWLVLGTDLALGSPTDEVMSEVDHSFSPQHLQPILERSRKPDGSHILSSTKHFSATSTEDREKNDQYRFSPIIIFSIILFLTIYIYAYRVFCKKRTLSPYIDLLYLLPIGLGGSVLFYISALSEHPFVNPNYNLWVIHPLHLVLGLPLTLISSLRHWAIWYHFANFVALGAFIVVAYFLPQHFNGALFLISLSLMIISGARYFRGYGNTKHS